MYVHVPFCLGKCSYCDFYSIGHNSALADSYVTALQAELKTKRNCLQTPLVSVFFGGGTPTALDTPTLARILKIANPLIDSNTEFSIEANPATLDPEKVKVIADSGVNRVNLGVQSFNDDELKTLGRLHNASHVLDTYNMLRNANMNNIGLDLIYAAPTQTLETWLTSLDTALALQPEHLSCYALTLEDGTPLAEQVRRGSLAEMDEDMQHACYYQAIERITATAMEHYEISNFALPHRRCVHNLTYWHNQKYLGLGPAATSYVGGLRCTNSPNLTAYMKALAAGELPPCTTEHPDIRTQMGETVMLALRLTEGIDCNQFTARFHIDIREVFGKTIERYCRQNALILNDQYLRISPDALFVSNVILGDMLEEACGSGL